MLGLVSFIQPEIRDQLFQSQPFAIVSFQPFACLGRNPKIVEKRQKLLHQGKRHYSSFGPAVSSKNYRFSAGSTGPKTRKRLRKLFSRLVGGQNFWNRFSRHPFTLSNRALDVYMFRYI